MPCPSRLSPAIFLDNGDVHWPKGFDLGSAFSPKPSGMWLAPTKTTVILGVGMRTECHGHSPIHNRVILWGPRWLMDSACMT